MNESGESDWLQQFMTNQDGEKESPDKVDQTGQSDQTDQKEDVFSATNRRRLDELDRMKKQASSGIFAGTASNLNNIDTEKYLRFCEFWGSQIKFTCTAPEGWEEEYAKYMQERSAKFGDGHPSHRIKQNGKRRHF